MDRKTYVHIDPNHSFELPEQFQGDDVRYPDALVEYFLEEFTQPGDVVFDPFCGYGTTLLVCERMGRIGYGVEIDAERAAFARGLLQHPERLFIGDSRKLGELDLPALDFSITSPPYRTRIHKMDPLSGYKNEGGPYAKYFEDMQRIYAQIARLLKPSSHAVIKVSNLITEHGLTPLSWDMAAAINEQLTFLGERIILWDRLSFGYNHSYALIFKNEARPT